MADDSLSHLEELGRLSTFKEVQEWARRVWAEAARENLRTADNLAEQLLLSAAECVPQRHDETWRAHIFIRLPSSVTSYGGYTRIRVAKATFSWPERKLLFVFEE